VCMHTYPLPFRLWAEKYRTGQTLVITGIIQVPGRCWPPGLKCRSRMHYYLADRQAAAVEPGARALLLDEQGLVSEASTANLLAYFPGEGLVSPPAEKVLRGISLAVVGELAHRLGIGFVQRPLRPEELARAHEVLLSSTPLCLLPVTRLGAVAGEGPAAEGPRAIGDSRPGPVFRRLIEAWSETVGVDIIGQAERFADRDFPRC